ncbi:hypothetical protein KM043_002427 [Ampulex compressa]|nr:hypothetical protein KM043_002427 [Ampulex compressa]
MGQHRPPGRGQRKRYCFDLRCAQLPRTLEDRKVLLAIGTFSSGNWGATPPPSPCVLEVRSVVNNQSRQSPTGHREAHGEHGQLSEPTIQKQMGLDASWIDTMYGYMDGCSGMA